MPKDDAPTDDGASEQLRREQRDERWRKLAARSRLKKRLLLFVGIPVALWAVWTQVLYPTYTARYELTIEVETPDGIKTGSSVIEARYGWEPTLFGLISGVRNSVRGEAVFVDLGPGKNIVVTFRGQVGEWNAQHLPSLVYDIPRYHRIKTRTGIWEAHNMGLREVPVENLPLTVTFPDTTNPFSAVKLYPSDISAFFGNGYNVSRATIQMTNRKLTHRIEAELPWLKGLSGGYLSGKRINDGSLLGLSVGDFKAGT